MNLRIEREKYILSTGFTPAWNFKKICKWAAVKIAPAACILFVTLLAANPARASIQPQNKIHIIQLDNNTINPITADYIVKSIDQSYTQGAQCLIIKMDTPGGLLESTRLIVKKMLTSKIPIVVYIAPSGSRAGSAGVFITYASHIAAMAPSTNIGAAHPVQLGGGSQRQTNDWKELKNLIIKKLDEKESVVEDEQRSESPENKTIEKGKKVVREELFMDDNPMESKILHDTVAFIKSIAQKRGRNIEWAIKSVTESLSITETEALEKGVVEIIAKNEKDLFDQLDGRTIEINGKNVTLRTKGAYIERINMDSRQKFFNILANPNIAYFLLILGFYGLLFEITHPGFGAPGILGSIFLILAFYSMQTLPTNYAGLALLILGLVLLISEAFVPGFGVLTLGGVVCLVLGSMLLFESVDPIMRVSRSAIYVFSMSTAGLTLFLVHSVIRSRKAKIIGGKEGLIGEIGEVQACIIPEKMGKVFIHGEIWNAVSSERVEKGEEIIVEGVNGLKLKVRRNVRNSGG